MTSRLTISTITGNRNQNLNDPRGSGKLDQALAGLRDRFQANRNTMGYWAGELSPSALSTATAISAMSFYLDHPDADSSKFEIIVDQIEQGFAWLVDQQNEDGGFGDTSLSTSNISTTMLVIAALHAAKREQAYGSLLSRAQTYVDRQGGIEGLRRRYGKDKTFAVPILANCAMAGIVPWKEVAALPFEAACVPQKFYHLLQLPVVSYAIPALVAIGQAKFIFDPPWDPIRRGIRKWAMGRSLNLLQRMQPASGGYLEAVPLTSFVTMALIRTDRVHHSVVENGIRFLIDSFRTEPASEPLAGDRDARGTWPIDTNLATWSTTLTINAMANDRENFAEAIRNDRTAWGKCLRWVLDCQNKSVHPFTASPPGGWGWTDLSGSVPDADDTPGALLALRNLLDTGEFESVRGEIVAAAENGVAWLLKLQNRDRGWPTFCRGWGKLPFDRSGSDITAHVIRGMLAWKGEMAHASNPDVTAKRFERAIANGFRYLEKNQHSDGSWLPLWFGNQDQPDDINPFYGTAKVLCAYRDGDRIDTQAAKFGLDWLQANQNPDGGWGGGPSIQWNDESLGHSSVEETALCAEVLLCVDEDVYREAATRGVEWLIRASQSGNVESCSPIGFYFAKLWYYEKSYPVIFSLSALARAKQEMSRLTLGNKELN